MHRRPKRARALAVLAIAFAACVAVPIAVRASADLPATEPSVRSSSSAKRDECADAAESAQAAQLDGRLIEARATSLRCAQESCPRVVRHDCTELYLRLDGLVPSVVFVAHDLAGRDLTAVRVSAIASRAGKAVDGTARKLADALDGKSVALDPGTYVVRFEAEGYLTTTQSIAVREGERGRRIEVTLRKLGERPEGSPRSLLAPVVIGSIGVAALASFGYFGGSSLSRYNELHGSCGHACSPSEISRVRATATIADVSLGVSIVALGVAAAWWFWPGLERPSHPTAMLSIAPTTGGAVAILGGVF